MTLRTFVVGLLAVLTVSCHRPPTQPLNDLVYPVVHGIRRIATSVEQQSILYNNLTKTTSGGYDDSN